MEENTISGIMELDGVNVQKTALVASIVVGLGAAAATWVVSGHICRKTFDGVKVFHDKASKISA